MTNRVVFKESGWRALYKDEGIARDITERTQRIADEAEALSSTTAQVRTDVHLTRGGRRVRGAVISYDIKARREQRSEVLLIAIDAGR